MKHKDFYDYKHVYDYLQGSVIRVANDPVMIAEVRQPNPDKPKDITLVYRSLGVTSGHKSIAVDDDAIDLNPVPLGMLSVDRESIEYGPKTSFYLQRIPVRKWKIGLTVQNTSYQSPWQDREQFDLSMGYLFNSRELVRTIKGRYIDLDDAIKLAQEFPGRNVAFSRRFCVNGDNLLCRNIGIPVGKVMSRSVVLDDDFVYLKQVLDEDLQ